MTKKLMFVSVVIVFMATLSFSQGRNSRYPDGRNFRAKQFHTFDAKNLVEINGKIIKIERRNTGYGRYSNGIELLVSEGNESSAVHLGPVDYLNFHNWQLKKGGKIRIMAFKGTGQNKGELFAAEIHMNGKSLTLRDKNGLPGWRQSLNQSGRGLRRGSRGFSGRNNRYWNKWN